MSYGGTPYAGAGYASGPSALFPDGYKADHVQRALSRLKQANRVWFDPDTGEVYLNDVDGNRMKHAYNLGVLVEVMARRWQDLEEVSADALIHLNLDGAQGAALDWMGSILVLPRDQVPGANADDEIYRTALAAKAAVNLSQGESPMLASALSILTDPDLIVMEEYDPATMLWWFSAAVENPDFVHSMLFDAKAEGILMNLIECVRMADSPARLCDTPALSVLVTGGGADTIVFLKTSLPAWVTAGSFSDGQIRVTTGAAAGDVRTVDSNGAVDTGLSWTFTVTAAWTAPPAFPDRANLYGEVDGLGLAEDPLLNILVRQIGWTWFTILKAAVPTVNAGDRAGDSAVVCYDSGGIKEPRTIDASGAVSSSPDGTVPGTGTCWKFGIETPFVDVAPISPVTRHVFIAPGGLLARVI